MIPTSAGTWLEYAFHGIPADFYEIIIAELSGIGFDSFTEGETLQAFIRQDPPTEVTLMEIFTRYGLEKSIAVSISTLEEKNWNELWESSFEPVIIGDQCIVRAPFHASPRVFRYELVIEPRMSFGTAHHETTALMINMVLGEKVEGKKVLDMGCGTGILAILAAKMGASSVVAIDNNEWAFHNTADNLLKNGTPDIRVIMGDADSIPADNFDLILANINRNVLLEDIPRYAAHLAHSGILMLSGFYQQDLSVIEKSAQDAGLHLSHYKTENHWVAAKFL